MKTLLCKVVAAFCVIFCLACSKSEIPNFKTEIHYGVCNMDLQTVKDQLNTLHLVPKESRELSFFDTKDKSYFKKGVVFRFREHNVKASDSTIKLRPVDWKSVPKKYFKKKGVRCEYDQSVNHTLQSCSYKKKYKHVPHKVSDRPEFYFSKKQLKYLTDVKDLQVDWKNLVQIGPIKVTKSEFKIEGFRHKLDLEAWDYPDGESVIEISTRVSSKNKQAFHEQLKQYFSDHKINLCQNYEGKTWYTMTQTKL